MVPWPYPGKVTAKTNNKHGTMRTRCYGTYRECDKVMRAIDNDETAQKMMTYWRVYYTFVREHSALDGLTPANAIGIAVGTAQNRWMDLIEKSV